MTTAGPVTVEVDEAATDVVGDVVDDVDDVVDDVVDEVDVLDVLLLVAVLQSTAAVAAPCAVTDTYGCRVSPNAACAVLRFSRSPGVPAASLAV